MAVVGRRGWLCELASHFRFQYLWILILGAILLFVSHHVLEAIVAGSGALMNLRAVLPLHKKSARQTRARTFRALMVNVWSRNHAYDKVSRLIREAQPDVIVLLEVNERWLAALHTLTTAYPFSKSVVLQRGFGILLLSRLPLEQTEVVRLRATGLPSIVAQVVLDHQRLTIIGTHPVSPTSAFHTIVRNQQLADLGEFIASHDEPLLVIGDLNTTSWSPAFQQFMRRANLRDSRVGFGIQPSWPSFVPLPLRIPIDHCLVSPHVIVQQRRVGPSVGSDHYPIIVDFSIGER